MTERVFERSAARRPVSVPIVYSSFVYRGPSLISGVGHSNPCSPFAESETKVPHAENAKKKHKYSKNDVVVLFVLNMLRSVRGRRL